MASSVNDRQSISRWSHQEDQQLWQSMQQQLGDEAYSLYPNGLGENRTVFIDWKKHCLPGKTVSSVVNHFYNHVNPRCCKVISQKVINAIKFHIQRGVLSSCRISKLLFQENNRKCDQLGVPSFFCKKGDYISQQKIYSIICNHLRNKSNTSSKKRPAQSLDSGRVRKVSRAHNERSLLSAASSATPPLIVVQALHVQILHWIVLH
ncbi:MAG: hypothetical protein P0S95_02520 [Rhabdochlamydiaceae bacterium]|nr:hypothetical protein [Candidatus Amphrikana amoebophyrae]